MKPSTGKRTDSARSLQGSLARAAPYLGVGMQLAGSMAVYVFLGYLADRWLGTQPWMLVAGACLGMVAFFVQLVRLVNRMNEETRADLAERHAHDDDGPHEDASR